MTGLPCDSGRPVTKSLGPFRYAVALLNQQIVDNKQM